MAGPFNGKTRFYQDVLGKGFIDYESEPVLVIGKTRWTRANIAQELSCVHLTAARRLHKALEESGIDSMSKLFKTAPEDLITIPGVGNIQLFVAMCALDAAGYNIEEWYGWNDETVTAYTLKRRKEREADKEKTGRREERTVRRQKLA